MDTNIQTGPDKLRVSFSGRQIFLGIDVHKKTGILVYLSMIYSFRIFIRKRIRCFF